MSVDEIVVKGYDLEELATDEDIEPEFHGVDYQGVHYLIRDDDTIELNNVLVNDDLELNRSTIDSLPLPSRIYRLSHYNPKKKEARATAVYDQGIIKGALLQVQIDAMSSMELLDEVY